MFEFIKKLFGKKTVASVEWVPTNVVDFTKRYWGHDYTVMQHDGHCNMNIAFWYNWDVNNNDGMILEMKSGKKMLFKITNLKACGDPSDMFFCDLVPVKYVE